MFLIYTPFTWFFLLYYFLHQLNDSSTTCIFFSYGITNFFFYTLTHIYTHTLSTSHSSITFFTSSNSPVLSLYFFLNSSSLFFMVNPQIHNPPPLSFFPLPDHHLSASIPTHTHTTFIFILLFTLYLLLLHLHHNSLCISTTYKHPHPFILLPLSIVPNSLITSLFLSLPSGHRFLHQVSGSGGALRGRGRASLEEHETWGLRSDYWASQHQAPSQGGHHVCEWRQHQVSTEGGTYRCERVEGGLNG